VIAGVTVASFGSFLASSKSSPLTRGLTGNDPNGWELLRLRHDGPTERAQPVDYMCRAKDQLSLNGLRINETGFEGLGLGAVEVIFKRTIGPVVGYEPARDASISTTTRATLMLPASHSSIEQ
jgi:hypothetical protein